MSNNTRQIYTANTARDSENLIIFTPMHVTRDKPNEPNDPYTNSIVFNNFILETYEDKFELSTKSETVFGRTDPIYNYEKTTRKITLAFTVQSFDQQTAINNFTKLKQLIKYSYPKYDTNYSLKAPPLMRLQFKGFFDEIGYTNGADFKYESPSGYENIQYNVNGMSVPRFFKSSFTFLPIHREVLGWSDVNNQTQFGIPGLRQVTRSKFPFG